MTNYQQAKSNLKRLAKEVKFPYREDKPLIRMIINDGVDMYSKDLNLSEHQRDLLSNYACKLHPL
jgi:hypothetical protein